MILGLLDLRPFDLCASSFRALSPVHAGSSPCPGLVHSGWWLLENPFRRGCGCGRTVPEPEARLPVAIAQSAPVAGVSPDGPPRQHRDRAGTACQTGRRGGSDRPRAARWRTPSPYRSGPSFRHGRQVPDPAAGGRGLVGHGGLSTPNTNVALAVSSAIGLKRTSQRPHFGLAQSSLVRVQIGNRMGNGNIMFLANY